MNIAERPKQKRLNKGRRKRTQKKMTEIKRNPRSFLWLKTLPPSPPPLWGGEGGLAPSNPAISLDHTTAAWSPPPLPSPPLPSAAFPRLNPGVGPGGGPGPGGLEPGAGRGPRGPPPPGFDRKVEKPPSGEGGGSPGWPKHPPGLCYFWTQNCPESQKKSKKTRRFAP